MLRGPNQARLGGFYSRSFELACNGLLHPAEASHRAAQAALYGALGFFIMASAAGMGWFMSVDMPMDMTMAILENVYVIVAGAIAGVVMSTVSTEHSIRVSELAK